MKDDKNNIIIYADFSWYIDIDVTFDLSTSKSYRAQSKYNVHSNCI